MVRAVTSTYADYLSDRFGGRAPALPRLEHIPLGVNPERYRPATPAERVRRRAALRIEPDAIAVLFVGRFTPHAKAHPFPMFRGLARGAESTGKRVHLILSGWAASDEQLRLFLDGARAFAPGLPVSVVNGLDPDLRFGVWQAADIATSLADSVQETFGLVVLEAMACGLPVVASDWDGYRDLVVDGSTGFLVPTYALNGATADASLRLLLGAVDYDAFLADCNQAIAVDPERAAEAYARLIADAELRRRFGAAGRERVLERFTWQRIVNAYEELWSDQDAQRLKHRALYPPKTRPLGPPRYPAPEVSFASYPTLLLEGEDLVVSPVGAAEELRRVLSLPLCVYAGGRVGDEAILLAVLAEASTARSLAQLVDLLGHFGVRVGIARATLAWLLKYGLLGRVPHSSESTSR
jgi:hypothetical protein